MIRFFFFFLFHKPVCFVFVTDNCKLRSPEQVQRCQNHMVELLLFFLKKTYPDDRIRIARLISATTELRSAKLQFMAEEDDIKWAEKIDIEFPALFYEIWST